MDPLKPISVNEQHSKYLASMTAEERYRYRIGIYEETKECVIRGSYTKPGEGIQSIEPSKVLSTKFCLSPEFERQQFETVFKVFDGDCLDTGVRLKKSFSPVVLNMANNETPGGGVQYGAGAQEESIFRRTDYFLHLPKSLYPINGAIYSPEVTVFRHSEANLYGFMEEPLKIPMIACSAIRHPSLINTETGVNYTEEDQRTMYLKSEITLSTALHFGHDAIVLSAFGCGAFRNPPQRVAEIFKHLLTSTFSNCFKTVVFAIFNDHNSRKNGGEGNVVPFERVFETQAVQDLDTLA